MSFQGFTNAIVAGIRLIREAIQSPNFLTNVSGWRIAKDGTAEFSDAVIRGEIVVGTPGDEQIVIAPNSGTGYPEIKFRSADGTKEGFINAAPSGGSPDKAWIGINASPTEGADLITRTARLWLLGDSARLEVVKSSDQTFAGGRVILSSDYAEVAMHQAGSIHMSSLGTYIQNVPGTTPGYLQLLPASAFLGVGSGNRIIVGATTIQIVSEDGDIQLFTNNSKDSTKIKRDGAPLLLPLNCRKFNGSITASIPTAPGAYADIPGYSVAFTKKYDDTLLAVDMHMGGFLNPGVAGTIMAGVRINAVDYDVLEHQINAASQYHFISGVQDTGGFAIPAGVYTVQARWKGTFAGATYNTGGIRCSLRVMEINP